nr:AICARFT/IMPCHase bienzyme family protein [Tanacetum cinerariifolium]
MRIFRGACRELTLVIYVTVLPYLCYVYSFSRSRNALISLSDKKNLDLLVAGLQELWYTIVSTEGTASSLEKARISITKVKELTNFPTMLDGYVKTLHLNVYGGILARRDQSHHMEALEKHNIGTFEPVFVNIYPFYAKVSSASGVSFDDEIENINIGDPTMIKAAVKFLNGCGSIEGDKFLPSFIVPFTLKSSLRYGENPHQKAAFYTDGSLSEVNGGGITKAIQHQGKEMSYNNYFDADAAWNCVCEFKEPTCTIVKHTNPCGALAKDINEFKSPIDGETQMFYEIVIAPSYSEKGLEILLGKSKTLRILEAKKNNRGKLSLR